MSIFKVDRLGLELWSEKAARQDWDGPHASGKQTNPLSNLLFYLVGDVL